MAMYKNVPEVHFFPSTLQEAIQKGVNVEYHSYKNVSSVFVVLKKNAFTLSDC